MSITEPMDEVAYIDHLVLDVIDHPADVTVGLDERFAPAERRFGDDPAALAGARRRRAAAEAVLRAVAARIDFADGTAPPASPSFVEVGIGR